MITKKQDKIILIDIVEILDFCVGFGSNTFYFILYLCIY